MLVALAYAEGGAPVAQGGGFAGLIPLILMFVIFYFLLIRPQQKKAKEHRKMVEELRGGDKVITAGGIHGTIASVTDKTCIVEIANGIKVELSKEYIISKK